MITLTEIPFDKDKGVPTKVFIDPKRVIKVSEYIPDTDSRYARIYNTTPFKGAKSVLTYETPVREGYRPPENQGTWANGALHIYVSEPLDDIVRELHNYSREGGYYEVSNTSGNIDL